MTKRQRADVVELLRCACDAWHSRGCGIGGASYMIDCTGVVQEMAVEAWNAAVPEHYPTVIRGYNYADVCLEAAQRLEEGEL